MGSFPKRFLKRVYAERIPLGGSIELTERCNLGCAHCYINQPAASLSARARELTLTDWKDLINQITKAGTLWLLITGGEPLLRPDFWDIYDYARRKGLLITLFTNGTLLTPSLADKLAEAPPHAIEITLYGATIETYEKVTGVAGSFAKCMRGIDLLLERSLPLELKSMAFRLNYPEIPAMQAYAESRGVAFRFDPQLNLRLDGSSGPQAQRLTPEEVVAFDSSNPDRLEDWRKFWQTQTSIPVQDDKLFTCGAGFVSFHIDPYGSLSPCVIVRRPSYDLKRGSFEGGWYNQISRVPDLPALKKTDCRSCEIKALCSQCPGWADLESGDPEQPVNYLCRITHLRADMLNINHQEKISHE
jgi:radical SAM protein with 4Fe4S-binding SPASM domain